MDSGVMRKLTKALAYCEEGHFKDYSDQELEELQESYDHSRWRKFCKAVHFPILGRKYNFQENTVDAELSVRKAIREEHTPVGLRKINCSVPEKKSEGSGRYETKIGAGVD